MRRDKMRNAAGRYRERKKQRMKVDRDADTGGGGVHEGVRGDAGGSPISMGVDDAAAVVMAAL
jgi:hypothetical protein